MPAGKPYGLYRKSDNKLLWRFESKATGIVAFAESKRCTQNEKYEIKELPDYARCPIDKDPATYNEVCRIVSGKLDWTIVNPEVDMITCSGTCAKKKPHTNEYFAISKKTLRTTCRECRNEKNKILREKHVEAIKNGPVLFECRGNDYGRGPHQVVLTLENSSYYGRMCPDCKKHQTRIHSANNKLKNPTVAQLREQLKDTKAVCVGCNKEKSVGNDFIIKTGRLNPSSFCKECYNSRGYDKKHYAKRRSEDLKGFLEYSAARMRNWRSCNAEHWKQYMKKYNSGVECKWNWYKNRAAEKQVPIDELHEKEIKELFLALCTYCGREPDIGTVTGLDRIDNDKGYTIDNIVPCCKSCNMMKRISSVSEFLSVVSRVAEFHDNPDMDLPYPISNMSNGGIVPTKYKTMEVSKIYSDEYNKTDTRCYLCNIPRSETPNQHMTVDRIDSDLDYIEDNVAPCCTACNYAKRDYILEEFIAHCHRIASRVDYIMEELEEIISKTSAGPSVILERPDKRKNNQYVPHSRAKSVLVRDPTKESIVVAAYPSRAAANCDLELVAIRENITKGKLFQGKFIVEECTREVYESTVVSDDVYQEFKNELILKK